MKVLLLGATGMIGQGVLRECLADPGVERVVALGRAPSGAAHPKVRDVVAKDLFDLAPHAAELDGLDACFFCLGTSAAGRSEADYRRVTKDLTLSVARFLVARSPGMAFVYVSGEGTDSTEQGRVMWARVKGETENALLALPFRAACMFRPGFIQPLHGIRSRTPLYRAIYAVLSPLFPVLERLFPDRVTDTARLGRAMLAAVRGGAPKVVDARAINALARA